MAAQRIRKLKTSMADKQRRTVLLTKEIKYLVATKKKADTAKQQLQAEVVALKTKEAASVGRYETVFQNERTSKEDLLQAQKELLLPRSGEI